MRLDSLSFNSGHRVKQIYFLASRCMTLKTGCQREHSVNIPLHAFEAL